MRATVVCCSGGARSRPVSLVTDDRWDVVRSMKPSIPDLRVGSVVSVAARPLEGGGNDST